MEDSQSDSVGKLLNNFIGYSQTYGNLLNKYSDDFYLNYFDRLKIDEAVRKIQSHQKQLGMPEFVRLFLSIIHHSQQQTLYLTISLIRLYKKIKEDTSNEKGVKFTDFTNFLCGKISQGDPDLIIPMREIPLERTIPDVSKVRDIDISPPSILNKVQIERPKIVKNKNKKDKKLDEKKPVSEFAFSPSLNAVIALGRLSSSITLYNPKDLKKIHKIVPSACKIMSKDVAILSLAFSERDKRIGCIINNIGITFWQASDNFSTQKIMGSNKSDHDPKICGDKIYFLSLFNQWVTTDKDTIYFWNIKEELISQTIRKNKATSINDVCQINHIRCLLVAYTSFTSDNSPQEKSVVLYSGTKQVSKLILENSGCHTLLYNESTQLVVILGYSNLVSVYQIDVQTYDINIIASLKGHTSILTCICNIPGTPMIISGDDIGYTKLWDLNYMRCLQGIKIAKHLIQISCYDNMLIYADSRINTIPIEKSKDSQVQISKKKSQKNCNAEQSYGIFQFFRKQEQKLWVITRKQAREIDIKTGRVNNILLLCNFQQQISAAAELYNSFVIGTSKGQLSKYGFDGDKKWKITAHQGQINTIKVDLQNHLIATVGGDNIIVLWSQKSMLDDKNNARKTITYKNKDVNLFQLSPYANIFVIGSTDNNVIEIWNYDTLKLLQVIQMEANVSSFKILADKSVIIVATTSGKLSVINFTRKQNKLITKCTFVCNIDQMRMQSEQFNDDNDDGNEEKQKKQNKDKDKDKDKELKNYFNTLAYCEDMNILLTTTSNGLIYCFKFMEYLTNQNYRRQYEATPAIRRSTKQSYDSQISRNKYLKWNIKEIQDRSGIMCLNLRWIKKVHRQNLIFISSLCLQKKYACTLSTDGYCKISQLQQNQSVIVGSIKLNYPLPVKWDIEVQNYCELKSQMHEAIAVIDTILKNYGYDLGINEQNNLDISFFLEKLLTKQFAVKKLKVQTQVMKDEYSQFDLKGQLGQKLVTLKSLQAYKRLQLIKKQNQQSVSKKIKDDIPHYQTSAMQKQAIRNYLSPNYLPKILNRIGNETQNNSDQAVFGLFKRIEEGLTLRQAKKNKDFERQNKCNSSLVKVLSDSCNTRKFSTFELGSKVKDKTVRQILGQINTKLQQSKRGKNTLYKSRA